MQEDVERVIFFLLPSAFSVAFLLPVDMGENINCKLEIKAMKRA